MWIFSDSVAFQAVCRDRPGRPRQLRQGIRQACRHSWRHWSESGMLFFLVFYICIPFVWLLRKLKNILVILGCVLYVVSSRSLSWDLWLWDGKSYSQQFIARSDLFLESNFLHLAWISVNLILFVIGLVC